MRAGALKDGRAAAIDPRPRMETPLFAEFARRSLFVLVVLGLAVLAWQVREVLLLLFGGILFAILLESLAGRFCRHAGLPRGWALFASVVLLVVLIGATALLFGARIAGQVSELGATLPQGVEALRGWLGQREWGQALLERLRDFDMARAGSGVLSVVNMALWSVIGVATNLLVIVFAGLFLAAQPKSYTQGVLELVPKHAVARAEAVLRTTGAALHQWLLGQLVSMAIVGVLTASGLWLLGVPAALALGLIAGVAEFVPVVGPIVAAIPGVLLGFSQGPATAFYVLLFYVAIQQVESYAITPLVQRAAVALPPIVSLFAVIAFGLVFGPLGVIFATPLAVATMVLVKMLYVEDVLGKDTDVPGR